MTQAGTAAPAVARALQTLTRRADFLRAASARRQGTPGFLLQARLRAEGDRPGLIRVGFTCSKKLGNAVTRNRAKRRLRAVARATLPQGGHPGWDYVLVGRPRETVARDFAALLTDCETALDRIHRAAERPPADAKPEAEAAAKSGKARSDPAQGGAMGRATRQGPPAGAAPAVSAGSGAVADDPTSASIGGTDLSQRPDAVHAGNPPPAADASPAIAPVAPGKPGGRG